MTARINRHNDDAKSNLPEFVKEAPSIKKHNFKIHIAIDFGTDGTGLISQYSLFT